MADAAPSPRDVVNKQLAAYNARALDAYCALFAEDAVLARLDTGMELARGLEAIRRMYRARFEDNPCLSCEILARTELGAFVIDHELVRGFEDRTIEVIAIYEVRGSLIQSVRFIWP